MPAGTNPFTVLSYVSGPALLTNSTALLLLSTSNRFARAIDRARHLVIYLEKKHDTKADKAAARELVVSQRRVKLIGEAMSRFYLSAAMFALATMSSIAGAVAADYIMNLTFEIIIAFAVISGMVGFLGLVAGAVSLVLESRLAVRSLKDEAIEAISTIERALHPEDLDDESMS